MEPQLALNLIKSKMQKCKPIYIYHCFKTIYPAEVKTHTEQYVAITKKYDFTKENAVITLATALIKKHGEAKIIKIIEQHFPNVEKINILKDKDEEEKEKIIDKTIEEGLTKQADEIMKIKQPAIKLEIKTDRIAQALNDLIKTKEKSEETQAEIKTIKDYWHDIKLLHEITQEQNEQYKNIITAQENKLIIENLDIITTGNEIWRIKSDKIREQNNELMKIKIAEMTTTFQNTVTQDTYDTLEEQFKEQIQLVNELKIDHDQAEQEIIELKNKLSDKVDIEELDELQEQLIKTTGRMELYKRQSEIKEGEIEQYIKKLEKFKIYEDPITPEMQRQKRKSEMTLKLQLLREEVENIPLSTPINRKATVQINTESFTPKITSTKEIKTNLYENKFREVIPKENIQNHSKITITKFNGEGTPGTAFDSWIKVFEKNADFGEWSNERRIKQLPIYLEKTAADFYDQLSSTDKNSIEIIKRKFKQRFDLIETPEVCISRLMLAKKKKDEGCRAFGQRIQTLYDKAYPYKEDDKDNESKQKWREEYKNIQLTQLFINGMNKEMILYLKGKDIKDFNVAIDSACEREEVLASLSDRAETINAYQEHEQKQNSNKQQQKKVQFKPEQNKIPENKQIIRTCTNCQKTNHTIENCFALNKHCNHCNINGHTDATCWKQRPCNMCKQIGHPQIRCPKRATINCDKCKKQGHYATECENQNITENRQPQGICNYCGNPGHNVSVCRVKQMKESGNNPSTSSGARNSLEGKGCFQCGGQGHFAANCPNKGKNPTN